MVVENGNSDTRVPGYLGTRVGDTGYTGYTCTRTDVDTCSRVQRVRFKALFVQGCGEWHSCVVLVLCTRTLVPGNCWVPLGGASKRPGTRIKPGAFHLLRL
eukprot:3937084-Rhodomonas_salina.1